MSDQSTLPAGLTHGATRLPSVIVESYNVEVKDEDGCDHRSACCYDDALAWREMLPSFFQHLHHGRCTV